MADEYTTVQLSKKTADAVRSLGFKTYEEAISSIVGSESPKLLKSIDQSLMRLAPDVLEYFVFPGDGGFEPFPAGRTTIDFLQLVATSPKGTTKINAPRDMLGNYQSGLIVSDTLLFMTVTPGYGTFFSSGAYIEGIARKIEKIELESSAPYNLIIALSTSQNPPRVAAVEHFQQRLSVLPLVKSNAAASVDTYTNFPFVPVSAWIHGVKTLDQSKWGVDFIEVYGWGTKTFIIRNLGPGAAEFLLYGSGSRNLAKTYGYVVDPDVGPLFIPIAAGATDVIETNSQQGIVQLRGRVAAAEAAGVVSAVIVEYIAVAPTIR